MSYSITSVTVSSLKKRTRPLASVMPHKGDAPVAKGHCPRVPHNRRCSAGTASPYGPPHGTRCRAWHSVLPFCHEFSFLLEREQPCRCYRCLATDINVSPMWVLPMCCYFSPRCYHVVMNLHFQVPKGKMPWSPLKCLPGQKWTPCDRETIHRQQIDKDDLHLPCRYKKGS